MSDETTDKPKIAKRPHGLGRGLSALLGDAAREEPVAATNPPANGKAVQSIEVSLIQPHPEQPRRHFDEGALQELADSIAKRGVIQPIIVRPHGGGFQIIAGERRWRASQRAHLHRIPAIVRDFDEQETLEIALIENIQREDLNPLEEAQGIQRLISDFEFTHERAASAVGRSRSAVSNLLRLLNLAQPVQTMLMAGDIDMGHARALLAVDPATQISLANMIIARRLSVREAEKLVANALANAEQPRPVPREKPRDIVRLEEELSDALATQVAIKVSARNKGQLVIDFANLDALDGVIARLRR